MLCLAAFTPHSPLLLPDINKDQLIKVEKTRVAMEDLADELYAARVETIVLISEHPTKYPDAFSINLSDPFQFDLSELGHLSFNRTIRPDLHLVDRIQRHLRQAHQPLTLTTDEALHYASAVPLTLLTENLPKIKLVPISYTELSAKQHFDFGFELQESIMSSHKRIAVIAAGDMSHTLAITAPGGFHKAGTEYDEQIQKLIATKNSAGLLTMDEKILIEAKQTSYLPIATLFGVLDGVAVKPQLLSYESPFGVGYLTANFVLK